MKAKGFTLAELMTTVAIIGFLATLTIPVIVHNIEEHRQRALLRKGIQSLNEAITVNIAKGKGDLQTYINRPGHANSIPEYLIRGIDTATNVKGLNGGNGWRNNMQFFETKDGIKFIFPNIDGRFNNAGAQCGNDISAANIIESPCPVIISTNTGIDAQIIRDQVFVSLFDEEGPERELRCLAEAENGDCENKGVHGYFLVYLTSNNVYMPSNIRNFLDSHE